MGGFGGRGGDPAAALEKHVAPPILSHPTSRWSSPRLTLGCKIGARQPLSCDKYKTSSTKVFLFFSSHSWIL